MITKARIMKARIAKITIVTTLVLLLSAAMLSVALTPTSAKKPTPQTWTLRLPSGYYGARQTFIKMFPDVTASSFHYSNPDLLLGPPGSPSLALAINLESVAAKSTDYVFYENWHLEARGVDVSMDVYILGIGVRVARIVCRELIADVNLWEPGEDGVFGTLTAKLRGEVLLSVPIVPGSPIPGYYYAGPELVLKWTFVEPRYTVTVTPDELSIPQGCDGSATVTVVPAEAGITGDVGFRFECRDWGGINGWVKGGGRPPLILPLHIHVEPWVPEGTYIGTVIVNDWTSGREYRRDIAITVTESGFTITVNGQDSPVDLGSIPKGTSKKYNVAISPNTGYSVGMPLYWEGTFGDFAGIGIEMPGGIPPPPCGFEMVINVDGSVSTGTREMDICVFDGGLGRKFTCHVIFEVV